MKTFTRILFASLTLFAAACDESDPETKLRAGVAEAAVKCAEEYYYTVEADTLDDAQTACDEVCSGVICKDPDEDAVATVPGNAGDKDTWKCDCKCGCPKEIDAVQLF